MKILVMLIRQQTIITIKLREALVFVLIITFLRQQNDLFLHLEKTESKIQRLIPCFYLSQRFSRFSEFISRKLLNPNSNKICYAIS